MRRLTFRRSLLTPAMLLAGTFASTAVQAQDVTLGSGDDSFTVTSTPATGTFDGGAGNDTLILGVVPGRGIFDANVINFEALTVSGEWALGRAFSPALFNINSGGGLYTIAQAVRGKTINNSGIFSLSQNDLLNVDFVGTITGPGTFIKNGSGTLSVGSQSYTGQTYVAGGTLNLTGALTGSTRYYLQNVATLTSALAGTIGGTVDSGGRSVINYGTIGNGSVTGRAIDLTYSNASSGTLQIENFGTISSFDDAIRQVDSVSRADTTVILNSGLIQSVNGGQAIDLSQRTGGTRQIRNFASGTIQSIGSSAILGAAVINNAGLIRSDAGADSTADAIDFGTQLGSQFYVNAGGLVSGARHGISGAAITGGAALSGVVDVNGAVFGRNGAGIAAAGNLVLTNRGTITGWADSISTTSEGDGIRGLGFFTNITNFGVIQSFGARGVDGAGRPLTGDAIVTNGGVIHNQSGGIIYGPDHGILVSNGLGGGAINRIEFINLGAIGGGRAPAIRIIGDQPDFIINQGIIRAYDGGIAVDMGGGGDTFMARGDSIVLGTLDGGAGNDRLILSRTTGVVASSIVNIERLMVETPSELFTPAHFLTIEILRGGNLITTTRVTADNFDFINRDASLTFRQDFDGFVSPNLTQVFNLNIEGAGSTRISTNQDINFLSSFFDNSLNVRSGVLDLGGSVNPRIVTVSGNALLTSARATTLGKPGTVVGVNVTVADRGQIANTNANGSAINATVTGSRATVINAGTISAAGNTVVLANGARIDITNSGLIQSTGTGSALSLSTAGGMVTNTSSGVITTNNGTAIAGRIDLRNAGLVMSNGGPNSTADGVDSVGLTNNGLVSGARHGAVNSQVVNFGTAAIIGRNGAGVFGVNAATSSLANTGQITGGWDGVSTMANGDGIYSTSQLLTIYNAGRIRGTGAQGQDSLGRAFTSDGIQFNGGTVINDPTGEITGLGYGITADNGFGGPAARATTITNRGLISGGIAGVFLVGTFDDIINSYGTIRGDGGTAIDLGAGNDTLNLFTGQSLIGLADGGIGTDTLNLRGTGSSTTSGAANFERVNLEGGIWTLTNMQLFSTGTRIDIDRSSRAIFEVPTDVNFGGFLTGGGGSTKRGAGTLFINTSGYTGSLTIEGGAVSPTATVAGLNTGASLANLGPVGGPALADLQSTAAPVSATFTPAVATSSSTASPLALATMSTGNVSGLGTANLSASAPAATLVAINQAQDVTLGSGDDSFTVTTSPATGTFDGGAGSDTLVLGTVSGRGVIHANVINFETLRVSGEWAAGSILSPNVITIDSGAGLYSTMPVVNGKAINNSGIFGLSAFGNDTFTGTISGTGIFVKNGPGTLTIGGQNYTGQTHVAGGTLNLTSTLDSTSYFVGTGTTLSSGLGGTVGGSVTSGGRIVTNFGTINNGAVNGRAIDLSYASSSTGAFRLDNSGTISSFDDAIRIADVVARNTGAIVINNSGLIESTNGGQAIDVSGRIDNFTFNGIVVTNSVGATIRSFGATAITGKAIIINSGLIRSDANANSTADAINFDRGLDSRLTVNANALVSGARHGVNSSDSSANVVVEQAGQIIGRNGAGVNATQRFRLTNRGTITGTSDGISSSSEGDGVRIFGNEGSTITNSGIIQSFGARGVDGSGRLLTGDGIATNGARITNESGGIIYGTDHGILVDDGAGGNASQPLSLLNEGAIGGGSGPAIKIVGNQNDGVSNNGVLRAYGGGIVVDLGGGNDGFSVGKDSITLGTVDGGPGRDNVFLSGVGGVANFDVVNFETLTISGGWEFYGSGAFETISVPRFRNFVATTRLTGTYTFGDGTASLTLRQGFDGEFRGTAFPGLFIEGIGGARITAVNDLSVSALTVRSGIFDIGAKINSGSYSVNSNALATSARAITFGDPTSPIVAFSANVSAGGQLANTHANGNAINITTSHPAIGSTVNNSGTINAAGDAIVLNNVARANITNSGLIQSTGSGRALALTGPGQITNTSSGVISSKDATAVVAANNNLSNSGLITSTGGPNSTADGVDSVGLTNSNVVSGARHGAVNSYIVNFGSGSIIGRNGAGVFGINAASNGLANTGQIMGGWDGVSTTANGDGVYSVNQQLEIYNAGRIRGTGAQGQDSLGRAFTSDGIQFNGGTVINDPTGEITGLGYGVTADNGFGGPAARATTITNRGLISGGIAGVFLVGSFNDTVSNYGTIRGDGGTAINLGAGDDTLNLFTGQSLVGLADGGIGTDTLNLRGSGSSTTSGAANFERVNILEGGIWTLTNMQLFSTGTRIDIASGSRAIFDVLTDVNFGGLLTGAGDSTKRGAGTLFINTSGYTGSLTIEGGAVSPTATLAGLNTGTTQPIVLTNLGPVGGPAIAGLSASVGPVAPATTSTSSSANPLTHTTMSTGAISGIGTASLTAADIATASTALPLFATVQANADATTDGVNFGSDAQINVVVGQHITGARHGVNARAALTGTLNTASSVFGRNGAGFNVAGRLILTNRGTITGWADGFSSSSEGDGIRALGTGNIITNFGIIQSYGASGVNGAGVPLTGDAVVMNGGSITNQSGAIIYGPDHGILVDNGSGAGAAAPFYLTNDGAIGGGSAPAIRILGNQADVIRNNGIMRAYDGGVAVDLGGGNDFFFAERGSLVLGTIDGGAGDDVLRLTQTSGTVATNVVNVEKMIAERNSQFYGSGSFETVEIFGSNLTATTRLSAEVFDFFDRSSSLTIQQDFDGIFAGTLYRGTLNIAGVGTTRISTTQNLNFLLGDNNSTLNVQSGILDLGGTVNADRYTISGNALLTSARTSTLNAGPSNRIFVTVNDRGQIENTNANGNAINFVMARSSATTINNAGTINSAGDAVVVTGPTVFITNSGLISATGAGRAIAPVANGSITNTESGVISSNSATAIVASSFTVRNSGLIMSNGGPNSTADGVDSVGLTNNGLVSGARHGAVNSQVVNFGTAAIIGRNGAGVFGVNSATSSLSNTGQITGGWDGVSTMANGDGIYSTNQLLTIYNNGRIRGTGAQGVDGAGRAFTADGIQFNGGTINNDSAGEIIGLGYGIVVDNGFGGSAARATTITNYKLISGGIAGVFLTGTFSDTINNYGTIRGDGGTAIDMGAGNDTLNLFTGQSLVGLADGGVGTDTLNLRGTGSSTTSGAANFERVNILEGGIWTLTNMQLFSTGTRIDIASGSRAIFDVLTDVNFGGFLTGAGDSTKRGAGTLFINTSGYTGSLTIEGGAVSPTATVAGLSGSTVQPITMTNLSPDGGPAVAGLSAAVTPVATVSTAPDTVTADLAIVPATPAAPAAIEFASNGALPGETTVDSSIGRDVDLAFDTGDTGDDAATAIVSILDGGVTAPVGLTAMAGSGTNGLLAAAGSDTATGLASADLTAANPSISTATIGGDYRQLAGTRYIADTSSDGRADLLLVGGRATIDAGAILDLTRDGGVYAIGTRYVVLAAQGGVTGSYTLGQTEIGGTEFRLLQATNAVLVELARSRAGLVAVGATGNQRAAATGLGGLANANPLYSAITLVADNAATRRALDLSSGEALASARTVALQDARGVTNTMRARFQGPVGDSGLWIQISGRNGNDDAIGDTAAINRSGYAVHGGYELTFGDGAKVGLAGGYTRTNSAIPDRQASAQVSTTSLLAYAGGMAGPVSLRAGIGYGWTDSSTRRAVTFAGFGNRLDGKFDGNVLSGFAEVGVPLALLGGTIEPFAGIESHRVASDAFAETGGAAALASERRRETFTLSTVGLRAQTPITDGLSARTRLGWEHGFGDLNPTGRLSFAGSAVPFTVAGAPLSRDAAVASIDLAWQPSDRLTITSGYSGTLGGNGNDNTVRLTAALRF